MKIAIQNHSKPAERIIIYKRVHVPTRPLWGDWRPVNAPLITLEEAIKAVKESQHV